MGTACLYHTVCFYFVCFIDLLKIYCLHIAFVFDFPTNITDISLLGAYCQRVHVAKRVQIAKGNILPKGTLPRVYSQGYICQWYALRLQDGSQVIGILLETIWPGLSTCSDGASDSPSPCVLVSTCCLNKFSLSIRYWFFGVVLSACRHRNHHIPLSVQGVTPLRLLEICLVDGFAIIGAPKYLLCFVWELCKSWHARCVEKRQQYGLTSLYLLGNAASLTT